MAHEGYHEPYEHLPQAVRDMHRALISLIEELEAVDWYYQRAAVTTDDALKSVLLHNAHEEIEHASMVLEWIRRNDPAFDQTLRKFLFREGSITEIEAVVTGRSTSNPTMPRNETDKQHLPSRPVYRATLGSLRDSEENR